MKPIRSLGGVLFTVALLLCLGCGDDEPAPAEPEPAPNNDPSPEPEGQPEPEPEGQPEPAPEPEPEPEPEPDVTRNFDLIRADRFTRLVIELDETEGFEAREATKEKIQAGLEELVDKPDGIEWVTDTTLEPKGPGYKWEQQELRDFAAEHFDLEVPENTIKIHVIYVDGSSPRDEGNRRILGTAFSHRFLYMYKETIEDACGAATPILADEEAFCEAAETSILTHEIGHLLGLVDINLPMVNDHKDPNPDHGRHDVNEDCVMYFAHEGEQIFDTLGGLFMGGEQEGLGFDENCLADIAAVREAR